MYRQDKNVLKPYLDIECENGWPVQKIMVGPGFNQNVVYDSVVHFLNNANVKNGMKTPEDYIKKIKVYFDPFDAGLQKLPRYKQLKKALDNGYEIRGMDLYGTQRILGNQVQSLCNEICNSKGIKRKTKEYIKNNYFSKCGIIVLKSSTPYIF